MGSMRSSSSIVIAFACDDNYAQHVAVVMQSIFANAAPEDSHEFHILTMELSSETQKRLIDFANANHAALTVQLLSSERLKLFPENHHHTLNTYLRLFIPDLLPEKDKIIYLDADILIFDSLRELWNHPLRSACVAAARDSMSYFGGSSLKIFEALNLPPSHYYFNAGVLLFNLKEALKIQLLDNVLAWAKSNPNLMFHSDQCILNALLIGKVSYLHPRWNLQVPLIDPVRFGWGCTQQQAEAVANPAIVHYVTSRKPWFRQYKLPYQHLYFQYLAQTPWKDDPLPPFTMSHRLQRLGEELDYSYKWSRSEVRRLLGRNPKAIKDTY